MNLVKKKEKRQRHEGLIGDEFQKQIEYLNQFLPAEHNLRYVHLDMARCKKRKDTEVMQTLADIATYAVSGTGIYHRRPDEVSSRIGKSPLIDAYREQVPRNCLPYSRISSSPRILLLCHRYPNCRPAKVYSKLAWYAQIASTA